MGGSGYGPDGTLVIRRRDGSIHYAGPGISIVAAIASGDGVPTHGPDGGVTLVQAKDLDLSGMDLSGHDLTGLFLTDCDLRGCRIGVMQGSVATLPVHFDECDLRGADMRGCDLSGITFKGCDLRLADLRGARGQRTDFNDSDLSGVCAMGMVISIPTFRRCRIAVEGTTRADFTGSDFHKSYFDESEIDRAVFDRVDFERANFTKAKVSQASFRQARLHGTEFERATFRGCHFGGASLRNELPGFLRRSKGVHDRTAWTTASGNTFDGDTVRFLKDLFAQEKATGFGALRPSRLRESLRALYDHAWGNVLDRTVPAFVADRKAQYLVNLAAMGVGAGVAAWTLHVASESVASGGLAGAGVGAVVAYTATHYLGRPVASQIGKVAALGFNLLKDKVDPLIEEARRRGANLTDLLVVFGAGAAGGKFLRYALKAGPGETGGEVISAATGDVHVTVCDDRTFRRAMQDLETAVSHPEILQSDIVLMRPDAEGPGPFALRLHSGGGLTAMYADREGEELTSRFWPKVNVRSESGMEFVREIQERAGYAFPGYSEAEARDCFDAREDFFAALLRISFGTLRDDRRPSEVEVTQDAEGRLTARYGNDGPYLASPLVEPDLEEPGVRFGMT